MAAGMRKSAKVAEDMVVGGSDHRVPERRSRGGHLSVWQLIMLCQAHTPERESAEAVSKRERRDQQKREKAFLSPIRTKVNGLIARQTEMKRKMHISEIVASLFFNLQ